MADQFKSCSVEGCKGNAHRSARGSKGFCVSHYARLRRHGDPLAGRTSIGEPLRFIQEVAINHTGGECLKWPFGNRGKGYGAINVEGELRPAHRYVCELVNGPPPTPEHEAAHSCGKGNEGCVSPGHLEWKTPTENQADRLIHGTHSRGERNGNAKLTEIQVRQILSLKGEVSQREIGRRFGISQPKVSSIHCRKIWGWVEIT